MSNNDNKTFYARAVNTNDKITIKDIFNNTFKSHTKEDMDEVFKAGLSGNIPGASELTDNWQRPWVYFRLLAGGIIAFLIFLLSAYLFGHDKITIGFLYLLPAIVVPLSIVIFFWELNIPRNIPIYDLFKYIVLGGILSSGICTFFIHITGISQDNTIGAFSAGLSEEFVKFLIVAYFLRNKNLCYGLNGLVVGACVGCGFAIFETNGYAVDFSFGTLMETGDLMATLDMAKEILILRGWCSIVMHTAWTAMYGGALALVKGKEKLDVKHFVNPITLVGLFTAMICHAFWNGGEGVAVVLYNTNIPFMQRLAGYFTQPYLPFVILVLVEWCGVILWITRLGIQQVTGFSNKAKRYEQAAAPKSEKAVEKVKTQVVKVEGISGVMAGKKFSAKNGQKITMGRAKSCEVCFPEETKGISREHCRITYKHGVVTVEDLGSSYGTFLENGTKLAPHEAAIIENGSCFYMADKINMFKIKF